MAGKRYENLDVTATVKTLKEIRQWQKERRGKVKDLSYVVEQSDRKEIAFLHENRTETTITWIGHSTFFIQKAGLNLVTDPVWANRMGLAKRLAAPGIPIADLPQVDIVLISHSHYDHLHLASLRRLKGKPVVLVPEGLGCFMRRKRFETVVELPWWGRTKIGPLEFHFVPAQHWTRRTLWDTNTSHWGGWIVQDAAAPGMDGPERPQREGAIYFAGDSGYFRGFKEIGERFRIDYALMPIGAYEPEWFMGMQHVTPEEAIQAFLDVKAETFIPMHYGAFRLADDTPKEALDRLLAEWHRLGLPKERLRLLKHGETLKTSGR
jgi:L-ascorbate metabolism protein UlaG (beta-lactamase superfamily)